MNWKWIFTFGTLVIIGFQIQRSGAFAKSEAWNDAVSVLTQDQYKDTVRQHPWSVVVVSATWCGPCKVMRPEINFFADKNPTTPVFVLDFDQSPDVVNFYGLRGVPAVLILRNGKEVKRHYGYQTQHELQQWLDETVRSTLSPSA